MAGHLVIILEGRWWRLVRSCCRPPPSRLPSSPVMVGCQEATFIEQQNIKPLSCRLELAPRQCGIPQLAWQTYSPFCFGVISFGMRHKDHGKLASVTAYVVTTCLNLNLAAWILPLVSVRLWPWPSLCVLDRENSQEVNKEWFLALHRTISFPLWTSYIQKITPKRVFLYR